VPQRLRLPGTSVLCISKIRFCGERVLNSDVDFSWYSMVTCTEVGSASAARQVSWLLGVIAFLARVGIAPE